MFSSAWTKELLLVPAMSLAAALVGSMLLRLNAKQDWIDALVAYRGRDMLKGEGPEALCGPENGFRWFEEQFREESKSRARDDVS